MVDVDQKKCAHWLVKYIWIGEMYTLIDDMYTLIDELCIHSEKIL